MKPVKVVVTRKRRWFVLRDFVLLALAATVFLLVRQVDDLQHQIAAKDTESSRQFAEYNRQLSQLRAQLGVKDQRIRQLTNQLIREGITPEPAPTVAPSPQPQVSPTPKPSARPSARPTRTPTAHPSPSCSLLLVRQCVTAPPLAWLFQVMPPFRLS